MSDAGGQSWDELKSRWPRGTRVSGVVVKHMPFGVFLDLGIPDCIGLIKITEIALRPQRVTEDDFPEIGARVEARVLSFDERNRQVWLTLLDCSPHE